VGPIKTMHFHGYGHCGTAWEGEYIRNNRLMGSLCKNWKNSWLRQKPLKEKEKLLNMTENHL
jgi:hypothetical protein